MSLQSYHILLWKADTLHGDRPLVLKQVFCGMLGADEQTDAMKEAKLLAELAHPNVLKFHDAFIHDRQFVCIITELCRDGDLSYESSIYVSSGGYWWAVLLHCPPPLLRLHSAVTELMLTCTVP